MRKIASLFGIVSLLALCSPARAQEETIAIDHFAGVGARAMGMGGAYIAIADDYTATYWNPAGLAQIRRIELYGGLSHFRDEAQVNFYGTPRTTPLSRTRLSAIGMAFPVPTYRGSLVFSAGFNRIKSFDSVFGIEGFSAADNAQKTGKITEEGGLGIYSIAGAWDVSPSISLGASMNIWDGEDVYSQMLSSVDTSGVQTKTYSSFEDEYDGVSLKLATMVKTPIGLRFGMTLETPVTYRIEEHWEGDRLAGFVAYELSMPYQFGAGVSWAFSNLLTVAADAVYSDWTQVRYKESPWEEPTKEDLNEDIQTQYKAPLRVHVGGEFLLPLVPITLRTGFYRNPIPFMGPRQPGDSKIEITNKRDYVTFGAGTLIDQVLAFDVAWVKGVSEQKEGNTTEKHREDRVFMSTAYRF
ncbi:MAG: outer membrane protein transport protein [Candidatus Latescibacterota bacterium]